MENSKICLNAGAQQASVRHTILLEDELLSFCFPFLATLQIAKGGGNLRTRPICQLVTWHNQRRQYTKKMAVGRKTKGPINWARFFLRNL